MNAGGREDIPEPDLFKKQEFRGTGVCACACGCAHMCICVCMLGQARAPGPCLMCGLHLQDVRADELSSEPPVSEGPGRGAGDGPRASPSSAAAPCPQPLTPLRLPRLHAARTVWLGDSPRTLLRDPPHVPVARRCSPLHGTGGSALVDGPTGILGD